MNQKKSIKGLANIAMLMNRAEPAPEAPKRERRDLLGIHVHTREKIEAAIPLGANLDPKHKIMMGDYLMAGLREAYNLGHADALEQNGAVEKLLEQQYDTRTKVLTPTVVAAVMEQTGLTSMSLNLAHMQTVFDRVDVQYTYDQDTNVMEYTVRPVAALDHGEVGMFDDPHVLDKTEQQIADELEDDVRHQVEDIEQARQDYADASDDVRDKIDDLAAEAREHEENQMRDQ